MSQSDHESATLEDLRPPSKCEIRLPPNWNEEILQGPLPTCHNDSRRFPRFHYRVRATLQCQETFPALSYPNEHYVVYTKDISREGLNFLHAEQLFPRQEICISLPDEAERHLQVVRCCQLDERCFLIGARFSVEFSHSRIWTLLRQYHP